MKVEVLTVDQVRIKPWRWWSDWIDVCVFSYVGVGYLLQMRVSRTNAKQFTTRGMRALIGFTYATPSDAGDLIQMPRPKLTGEQS